MKASHRPTHQTRVGVVATILAVVGLLFYPAPAGAQEAVDWSVADFSAAATGTVAHADALQSGDIRVENVDVAFSGATVDSQGLPDRRLNEMQREYQPSLPSDFSYARGSGLEIGLVQAPDAEAQAIVAGKAEAAGPSNPGPNTEEVGPADVDPAAYAALLRGEALARWNEDFCLLGDDISRGLGHAADVQLVDAGGDENEDGFDEPLLSLTAPEPERAVSQSVSRTFLMPQDGAPNFGLAAENRQTIAPVTLFKGSANETTIEFLGEWVLRAEATGLTGGATVHYGPGEVSPETPILQLIDDAGEVTRIITTQDLVGDEGLVIEIPGVAELAIGEDPRAIGGDAESEPTVDPAGTFASAAVDVVRIKLLEQVDDVTGEVTQRAADIRVGHMEVDTQVPAGGIGCEIPVDKSANPTSVSVGETFVTPITVNNPFDCELTQVRVEDSITTSQGATFTIVGSDPTADSATPGDNLTSATVVWNDIGPIAPGESATVTVTIEAQSAGVIEDIATATATLANCSGEGLASAVAGAGIAGVSPVVQVAVAAVLGEELPRTGPGAAVATLGGLFLLSLAGAGSLIARRFGS